MYIYNFFPFKPGFCLFTMSLKPHDVLAFILFTHQYYISTKALKAAFKLLCRGLVLKCTPYCEKGIAGPWTPITRHKSVSLFNYTQAFCGAIFYCSHNRITFASRLQTLLAARMRIKYEPFSPFPSFHVYLKP